MNREIEKFRRVKMGKAMRLGSLLFAVSVLCYAVLNLVCPHSVYDGISSSPHLPVIPWVPAHPWMAYLTGLAFLAPSLALLVRREGRVASTLLGIIFVFFSLTLAPFAAKKPLSISLRTIVFETLAMAGAAFVLAGARPEERELWLSDAALDKLGRYLFALSL